MTMSLDEADKFLNWNQPPSERMTIPVHIFIQLTSELLDAAGFNLKTSPTVVQIIINTWSMEVILPADKNDYGAYECEDKPGCWLRSVTVEMDNVPHDYYNTTKE